MLSDTETQTPALPTTATGCACPLVPSRLPWRMVAPTRRNSRARRPRPRCGGLLTSMELLPPSSLLAQHPILPGSDTASDTPPPLDTSGAPDASFSKDSRHTLVGKRVRIRGSELAGDVGVVRATFGPARLNVHIGGKIRRVLDSDIEVIGTCDAARAPTNTLPLPPAAISNYRVACSDFVDLSDRSLSTAIHSLVRICVKRQKTEHACGRV
jgi:hypothetical protein